MKQSQSQIHIWEAFEAHDSECPICDLENQSKKRIIETLYTEMVMDYNFQASRSVYKTFCKIHFNDLYEYNDKLGLAIIVDRMLNFEKEKLALHQKKKTEVGALKTKKLFHNISTYISTPIKKKTIHTKECYLCNKIEGNTHNSIQILLKTWETDESFRALFNSSKGFCMQHFYDLITIAEDNISNSPSLATFIQAITELQYNNTIRLQEELQWFIKKFDYRFKDSPWGTSKDSLVRSITKLIGSFK